MLVCIFLLRDLNIKTYTHTHTTTTFSMLDNGRTTEEKKVSGK